MTVLLAIDTTDVAASIALRLDADRIEARLLGDGPAQSQRLLQAIEDLLREAGLAASSIDAIAVSIGPGAFTGVRLGLAAAQGLALAWNRPLRPVSSLAALALGALTPHPDRRVLALRDARMGELYGGWYAAAPSGIPAALVEEGLWLPAAVPQPAGHEGFAVVGDGWAAHAPALEARLGSPVAIVGCDRPGAIAVASLAAAMGTNADRAAEHVEPAYLRNKVALTTDERARSREPGSR